MSLDTSIDHIAVAMNNIADKLGKIADVAARLENHVSPTVVAVGEIASIIADSAEDVRDWIRKIAGKP